MYLSGELSPSFYNKKRKTNSISTKKASFKKRKDKESEDFEEKSTNGTLLALCIIFQNVQISLTSWWHFTLIAVFIVSPNCGVNFQSISNEHLMKIVKRI